jgi:hypothetical protein
MTLDEAAKRLGIRWRTLKRLMVEAGWLIPVGDGEVRCAAAAIKRGDLEAIVAERQLVGRAPIVIETGYSITEQGFWALAKRAASVR